MQCPKCKYEPTMAEMLASPDDCVKCGVSYGAPPPLRSLKKRGRIVLGVSVAALILLAIAAGYFGITEHRKQTVIAESASYMRTANGYVAEMLDEKASLTNAAFLEKLPRRIQNLDDLNAKVLAMDDTYLPGLKSATADYVRASRSFLLRFADMTRAEIGLSAMKAGHATYEPYVNSPQGRQDLARSDAQMKAELDLATAQYEAARTMSEKIERLGVSSKILARSKKRFAYLASVGDVEESAQHAEKAKASFETARVALSTAGRKLSDLANEPMPAQPWFDK